MFNWLSNDTKISLAAFNIAQEKSLRCRYYPALPYLYLALSYAIFIGLDLCPSSLRLCPAVGTCQPISRTVPVWLRFGRVAGFKMNSAVRSGQPLMQNKHTCRPCEVAPIKRPGLTATIGRSLRRHTAKKLPIRMI